MERRPAQPKNEPVFFTEIVESFESLRSSELKTETELAERDKNLAQLSDEIRTRGAQRGAELRVGLILAAGNNEMIKQGMNSLRLLKRLQEIDEKLRSRSGQTIAWLRDEVVPGKGPQAQDTPNTQIVHLLNIGILPHDAKIEVSSTGNFSVPVTQYIGVEITNATSEQELDFDDENIIPYAIYERGIVTEPDKIFLHLDTLLSPRRFMAIGNKEVGEVVEANELEDDAYMYFAVTALLESYKMSHPEEPDLPPAAV